MRGEDATAEERYQQNSRSQSVCGRVIHHHSAQTKLSSLSDNWRIAGFPEWRCWVWGRWGKERGWKWDCLKAFIQNNQADESPPLPCLSKEWLLFFIGSSCPNKYHRLSAFNNKYVFLTVLEVGSLTSRSWPIWLLARAPLQIAALQL